MPEDLFSPEKLRKIKQWNEYPAEKKEECLLIAQALLYLSQDYQQDEQWHKAHKIAQNVFSYVEVLANWTHALLHKIEGDLANAQYWYQRSGKQDQFGTRYSEEAKAIWQGLMQL